MKANLQDISGKQVSLRADEAVRRLMQALCESISLSGGEELNGNNIFGRPVNQFTSANISSAIGFSLTGLRAGCIVNSAEISTNLENISSAVRMHIPLVIFAGVKSQHEANLLSHSGATVFCAVTKQEVIDLVLCAYRIAELSLIPVVVCIEESLINHEDIFFFPDKNLLQNFAINPEILISSPTPSQQIILGKSRKRIPGWFNADFPVSLGAAKQLHEAGLESAAQQKFFSNHLDSIIAETFREFDTLTGRKYGQIIFDYKRHAEYLLACSGNIFLTLTKAIDELPSKKKAIIGALRFVQLNPFPSQMLPGLLKGIKTITVLEQVVTISGNRELLKNISVHSAAKETEILSGFFADIPSDDSLHEVILNMLPDGKKKTNFFIDMEFTKAHSEYPKHQVLLQAIAREYPDVQYQSIAHTRASKNKVLSPNIPFHLRQFRNAGAPYSKLSRFFDDTASFFNSHPEELVADPFQAIPVMPPSSAAFNADEIATENTLLPVFNSARCTGCGDCFLHCPHSAINPLVIGIENLIKGGITIAYNSGNKITMAAPFIKNLSGKIHELIRHRKGNDISISEILRMAFEDLSAQMNLQGEKLDTARKDIDAISGALNDLPVTLTETFYREPDSLRKDSGEIFTLAIDVNSCTGCSVCESVCNDDALMMTDQSPEIISAHQNTLSVWEHLPDSSSETIQRLLDAKKYNPFSAVLLNRHFNLSLNGKSNTGSDASKSIIHLVTAVAESVRQPKVKELIQQIEDLTSSISQNIHSQLQSSLPSKDFDSLAKVLAEIKEDRKPFEEVVEHLGGSEHLKLVDTKSLKRKVKLAQSLRALMWLLAEGVSGTGRGRTGFVLDGTLPWSNSYPWNNFTAPVVIDMYGSTPELALGIAQGQLTQLLDNIKIIRRAQLESEGNYEPEIQDAQIAELSWNDLTEKEKSFVPPVILAGSKSKIADKDFTAMVKILDCNLPLKIIVTDDGAPAAEHASAEIISGISNLIPAVALQKAFVLKSSLAAPQHLFSGLIEAIGSSKPALVWVHVPSEAQHILPASAFPKIFSLALNSRAFPLFNFKPEREGKLISSKIEINENPQVDSPWMQIEFSYNENGETKNISYSLTWADWAYTLKSWHNHFIPYADDMGKAISVSDYISLAQIDRAGKCPVIFRVNNDESLKKYKVSGQVIDASEACAQSWQLLREISGDLTEFPDKLHLKIETELSEKYERKMAEQKNEYENKFSDFEAEHLQRIRIKLKEKLMMLSQLHSGHSN